METLPLILLALLGTCAGSFAYAMTLRMSDGRDWVKGRSECEKCKKELQWHDLVPLVSWLSTKGRCRYCRTKLSAEYPIVELFGALSFGVSYLFWPYGFTKIGIAIFATWLVMLTVLLSLIIFDLKWFILPDKLVYSLVGIALASKLFQIAYYQDTDRLISVLLGVCASSVVFYLLYELSSGRYIGGGDVKYSLYFGILLASPFKSLLVISCASIIGTILVMPDLVRGKTKMSSKIPFGPSLIAATFILYIFGDRLVSFLTTFYLFP